MVNIKKASGYVVLAGIGLLGAGDDRQKNLEIKTKCGRFLFRS